MTSPNASRPSDAAHNVEDGKGKLTDAISLNQQHSKKSIAQPHAKKVSSRVTLHERKYCCFPQTAWLKRGLGSPSTNCNNSDLSEQPSKKSRRPTGRVPDVIPSNKSRPRQTSSATSSHIIENTVEPSKHSTCPDAATPPTNRKGTCSGRRKRSGCNTKQWPPRRKSSTRSRRPTPVTKAKRMSPPVRRRRSRVRITSSRVRNTSSRVRNTSSRVGNTSSRVRNTSSRVGNTSSRVRNTSSRVRNTSSRVRNTSSRSSPISSENIASINNIYPEIAYANVQSIACEKCGHCPRNRSLDSNVLNAVNVSGLDGHQKQGFSCRTNDGVAGCCRIPSVVSINSSLQVQPSMSQEESTRTSASVLYPEQSSTSQLKISLSGAGFANPQQRNNSGYTRPPFSQSSSCTLLQSAESIGKRSHSVPRTYSLLNTAPYTFVMTPEPVDNLSANNQLHVKRFNQSLAESDDDGAWHEEILSSVLPTHRKHASPHSVRVNPSEVTVAVLNSMIPSHRSRRIVKINNLNQSNVQRRYASSRCLTKRLPDTPCDSMRGSADNNTQHVSACSHRTIDCFPDMSYAFTDSVHRPADGNIQRASVSFRRKYTPSTRYLCPDSKLRASDSFTQRSIASHQCLVAEPDTHSAACRRSVHIASDANIQQDSASSRRFAARLPDTYIVGNGSTVLAPDNTRLYAASSQRTMEILPDTYSVGNSSLVRTPCKNTRRYSASSQRTMGRLPDTYSVGNGSKVRTPDTNTRRYSASSQRTMERLPDTYSVENSSKVRTPGNNTRRYSASAQRTTGRLPDTYSVGNGSVFRNADVNIKRSSASSRSPIHRFSETHSTGTGSILRNTSSNAIQDSASPPRSILRTGRSNSRLCRTGVSPQHRTEVLPETQYELPDSTNRTKDHDLNPVSRAGPVTKRGIITFDGGKITINLCEKTITNSSDSE